MALYIRVIDGEVESVGAIPFRARRLDTGQLVDPSQWMRACGYYNVETVTLDDMPAGLTPAQQEAIIDAVLLARQRLEARRFWLEDTRRAWALAKDKGQDYLDGIPPWPTGPVSLALHGEQITYLRVALGDVMRWIVGGGTIHTPGIGDVLKLTVEVVNELIENADNVEPPAAVGGP